MVGADRAHELKQEAFLNHFRGTLLGPAKHLTEGSLTALGRFAGPSLQYTHIVSSLALFSLKVKTSQSFKLKSFFFPIKILT